LVSFARIKRREAITYDYINKINVRKKASECIKAHIEVSNTYEKQIKSKIVSRRGSKRKLLKEVGSTAKAACTEADSYTSTKKF
jgi:hypothetical protein